MAGINPELRNWTGDRLTASRISAGQRPATVQASRRTHSPSGKMTPISSASGMNDAGEIKSLRGMAPTNQCLEAADPVGREIERRLVVQLELAGPHRFAQIALQFASRPHLGIHRRFEEVIGAPAFALCVVEGEVRIAHQDIGADADSKPPSRCRRLRR